MENNEDEKPREDVNDFIQQEVIGPPGAISEIEEEDQSNFTRSDIIGEEEKSAEAEEEIDEEQQFLRDNFTKMQINQIRKAFRGIDDNGDGEITKEELKKIIKNEV